MLCDIGVMPCGVCTGVCVNWAAGSYDVEGVEGVRADVDTSSVSNSPTVGGPPDFSRWFLWYLKMQETAISF
jgi:hypothetical protein